MGDFDSRRRIIIDRKIGRAEWVPLSRWAADNNYDTFAVPFTRLLRLGRDGAVRLLETLERGNMTLEAGGQELSFFMPRRLFLFRPDMFRMEAGRRKMRYNFCPTSPAAIDCVKKNAARLVKKLSRVMPERWMETPVFHLWPERARESTWCSCPACRAFTPAEQYLIAVNSAAGVFADLCLRARVSRLDLSENPADGAEPVPKEPVSAGIRPRDNTFAVKTAPPALPRDWARTGKT